MKQSGHIHAQQAARIEARQRSRQRAFAKRGFDKVTVGEIAARAHCSTATIYEVYGSKSELYFEVRREKAKSVHIPIPRKVPNAKSLQSLLSYACDRIRSVSEIPDIQNYYKPPKRIDKKRLRGITRDLVRRATPLPTLKPTVEQAMQAGLLRRTDAEATAYLIWTALGWEAAMLGFLYDSEVEIDPAEVIRMVFTPLVSRKGYAEMQTFLNTLSKTTLQNSHAATASLLQPDLLP